MKELLKVTEKYNHHLWEFISSFIGIALIGSVNSHIGKLTQTDNIFLIGSFGATAVLLYSEIKSPLAQPRNVILGHVVSAVIGVTFAKIFTGHEVAWVGAALSVSVAIVVMSLLKASHPPGGATAIIANIGSEKIKDMGYMYVITPVFSGVVILMTVALIISLISKNRKYPFKPVN